MPPSVLIVSHASEPESSVAALRLQVSGMSFAAERLAVDAVTRICDAFALARIADHAFTVVFDSPNAAARRDLLTFVGSVPLKLRPRFVVLTFGELSVDEWVGTGLRVVDSTSALREIVALSEDCALADAGVVTSLPE